MAKILTPVRLDQDKLEALDKIVKQSAGERSDHLRRAVEEYIERHGEGTAEKGKWSG